MNNEKTGKKIVSIIIYVVLAAILIIMLLPLISMIGTAIKTHDAALTTVSLFQKNWEISVWKISGMF